MGQQTDQYTQILLSKKIGKEVRSYSKGYGIAVDPKSGKSGIVDSLGTITFNDNNKSDILHLSADRFILKIKDGSAKGKTALIDKDGNQLIPLANFKYRTWENKDRLIYTQDGKDCVFDYNGKQILPFYDKIVFASENRFFIKKEEGWFIYNYDGKQMSDRIFDEDLRFYKGRTYVTLGDKKGEIIDNDGKVVSTISEHDIENINAFPFLITKNTSGNKYGIINEKEAVLADEIYDLAFVGREYIYLTKDNKVTVFSKKDQTLYPIDFHFVNHLFNGLFKTQKDERNPKIAVVKLNGELVFPKEYDVVEAFKIQGKSYLYVSKDGEERLLDENLYSILGDEYQIEKVFFNNLIVKKDESFYKFSPITKIYTLLKNITEIKPFQYYPAIIAKNADNLYGMVDEDGNQILPFEYDDIVTFLGDNEVIIKKGNKFGLSNYKGEPLVDVIYDKYTADRKGIKLTKGKDSEYIYTTSQKDKTTFE